MVMENNHERWTEILQTYYNTRFKEIQGGVLLQVADIIEKQNTRINKYGMSDKRYDRAINDILSTFFTRTFQNMMPLVLEVLEKMKTIYGKEKETICVSYGPVDLFKFINEIYDLSFACVNKFV